MTNINKIIEEYKNTLISAEKTEATAEQYARQIRAMAEYLDGELTQLKRGGANALPLYLYFDISQPFVRFSNNSSSSFT